MNKEKWLRPLTTGLGYTNELVPHFRIYRATIVVNFPGRRFVREFAKYRYGVFDEGEQDGTGQFPGFFCPQSVASNATARSLQQPRYSRMK